MVTMVVKPKAGLSISCTLTREMSALIGDCYKLLQHQGIERKAVLVIGYEHTPPQIDLSPLFAAFETIANTVCEIQLSQRCEVSRSELRHPVHQQLRVAAWEVLGRVGN